MDGKLNLKHKTSIIRFIGSGAKDFHLLYSFTRDGANATTFHQKCDNKGPTVTVVYNTKDSIFGGYVEKSWTSDSTGAYVKDDRAFLFRLESNGKIALNKFPVKASDKAFYCIDTHGPVFGSGHDLDVFSDTLTAQGNQFSLNGVMKMGTTYDMGGVALDKVTDNVNTVFDVEVYSLSESPLVSVWRASTGWELEDLMLLKKYAESYAPPHGLDVETANILVIGPVGAGKSSFFNTVASVFRGHISDQAVCGSAEKSITSKYRMYRVRSSQKQKPLKFCLCDTMGLEESQGIDAQELGYVLDGHVPDGYQFNPTTPISSEIHGFVKFPTLGQKIHCVCFVFDGNTATILSEKMLEKVKSMQAKVRQKGLPQAIVLTKIDNVCSYVEEDITKVYQSETIKNLVDKVSNIFGVPRSFILPLKNYEKEIDVDTHVSILAMHTLKRLLLSTENHLFNFLDTLDVKQQEVEGRHGK
ncbi:interferon-induced protein 44-like isoform X2 [Ruditapes philippinarum]|uniref:interferon-induced protein 44-like isoform X2 n=1 Tax=Ruditapes philippinarum TaxID=129788 RepID=UPI00295AAA59|nr:interferon-induced protein 44-like isoform X2 [Ruditapes philippinarum]